MNNPFLTFFSLVLLVGATFSCHNENFQNCEAGDTQQLETFYKDEFEEIPCSLQNIDAEVNEVNLIIKDQTDFEEYFSCSDQFPDIDFDKYFILAGRYRHYNCAGLDSQEVLVCKNKVVFRVRMLKQDCHAFTNVFYAVVLEKGYSSLPVAFDVQFEN